MSFENAMRIKSIGANNFKSLVDFKIELAQFNCLIGLNGAGKSTVLQFVDFVARLVEGDMEGWLEERKWKASDLKSKLTKKVNIELSVAFADSDGEKVGSWEASYSPSKKRCTQERIDLSGTFIEVAGGKVRIGPSPDSRDGKDWSSPIAFDYEGSILSALKENLLPPPILDGKKLVEEIKSLDLLSPEYMRLRTRESSGSLGLGGQKLAAFLYELGTQKRSELAKRLRDAYPELESLGVKSLRSGWKQLQIAENYRGHEVGAPSLFGPMTTEARHINDGLLRLIAILAELRSCHRFLLFDEIENGINPEIVEFVVDELTSTDKQVLVTTHSPMILNYLDDEIAKSGVIYLYKTPTGVTKATRFFSIPSIARKLEWLGPGEAFVDTNLKELAEEILDRETGAR